MIVNDVLDILHNIDIHQSPPAAAQMIHRHIREITGDPDPYRDAKKKSNHYALKMRPGLSEIVERSIDPLRTALLYAIAGNVIDFGTNGNLDESAVKSVLDNASLDPFTGRIGTFRSTVEKAGSILYLTDNAGEIVFDRLLIEKLPSDKITVSVRGGPVINDATMADAHAAGLPELVNVIDNGSDAPGTILEDCSEEFRNCFEQSDLIIAKGQGNYETLIGTESKQIFFLLRIKCPLISKHTGIEIGTNVLIENARQKNKDPLQE